MLTLNSARTDDPLKGITPPRKVILYPPLENGGNWHHPDHLQHAEAQLASQLPIEGKYHSCYQHHFDNEDEAKRYTNHHYYHYYYGRERKDG